MPVRFVIIGGGPAGNQAASHAARHGAKVTLVERDGVRPAAALRADAMDVSDQWVAEGCDLDSPLVVQERELLVRSYAALLSAVHRGSS